MNLLKKFILSLPALSLLLLIDVQNSLAATCSGGGCTNEQDQAFQKAAGLNPSFTIGTIAANIIKALLGLLGIIFVALLVYAGFQWMTAEGNEEKIEKAKQTITRAIIGLAIVIAAYSITYFVFNALNGAANGGINIPG